MPKPSRAPTLWAIVTLKLLRGILLLSLALGAYNLVGQDLRPHFEHAVRLIKLDPETDFFDRLGDRIEAIKPESVPLVATGTLAYGLLSLTEAIGLAFRLRWVGWIVLAESGFFIPVECYALLHRFSIPIAAILVVNVAIVAYLWRNRERFLTHV